MADDPLAGRMDADASPAPRRAARPQRQASRPATSVRLSSAALVAGGSPETKAGVADPYQAPGSPLARPQPWRAGFFCGLAMKALHAFATFQRRRAFRRMAASFDATMRPELTADAPQVKRHARHAAAWRKWRARANACRVC